MWRSVSRTVRSNHTIQTGEGGQDIGGRKAFQIRVVPRHDQFGGRHNPWAVRLARRPTIQYNRRRTLGSIDNNRIRQRGRRHKHQQDIAATNEQQKTEKRREQLDSPTEGTYPRTTRKNGTKPQRKHPSLRDCRHPTKIWRTSENPKIKSRTRTKKTGGSGRLPHSFVVKLMRRTNASEDFRAESRPNALDIPRAKDKI
jgi:hypothetical protein